MLSFSLVAAAVVLAGAVGVGVAAHELLHAAVLRAAGVPVVVRLRPGESGTGVSGSLASVRMERVPPGVAPWQLRLAALAPLALAFPFGAVVAGVVPDPIAGDLFVQLALVGWLACALPSPDDFSIVFHAEQVIRDRGHAGP